MSPGSLPKNGISLKKCNINPAIMSMMPITIKNLPIDHEY